VDFQRLVTDLHAFDRIAREGALFTDWYDGTCDGVGELPEKSLREASTNSEWKYVAGQRRARSHATTAQTFNGSRYRISG